MYLVVPFSRLPPSLLARRASPKSPSFTRPCASTSRLLGLMSPWITPLAWRNCKRAQAARQARSAGSPGRCPRPGVAGCRLPRINSRISQPLGPNDVVDRQDVGCWSEASSCASCQ